MDKNLNITEQIQTAVRERLGNAFLGISAETEVHEMVKASNFLRELALPPQKPLPAKTR